LQKKLKPATAWTPLSGKKRQIQAAVTEKI